jgi:hypothetical protein
MALFYAIIVSNEKHHGGTYETQTIDATAAA